MNGEFETAGELGEFPLIERLLSRLRHSFPRAGVLVEAGDDAAVIDAGGGRCWVLTCDVLIQGVHLPKEISGLHYGRKALAVNLSDIAAMGARPRGALVSLGVPEGMPVPFLDDVYDGLNRVANRWEVPVLGGNVTRTDGPFFIDVFALGEVRREHVLLRSGAKEGDHILVTGYLGDAAAGLYVLNHPEVRLRDETHTILTYAQLRPQPRVKEGMAVAERGLATAMIDISDGLAADLGHLCAASGVGAVLWEKALPISPSTLELAATTGYSPVDWALYGGEAYQLLLTAPADGVARLREAVREAGGLSLTPIGEIVPERRGRYLQRGDSLVPLEARGWDHLKRENPPPTE